MLPLLAAIFFGVVGPCFCWGFWQKWVVGCGFLVVKLWWIAGGSWEVDGQDSGSKNMPLFRIIFEGFPFWEFGLDDHPQDQQVTGICLVDETSGLMVISQFGKIIRIDTKSIHAGYSQNPTRRGALLQYQLCYAIDFIGDDGAPNALIHSQTRSNDGQWASF
jgi:hypothetical protein